MYVLLTLSCYKYKFYFEKLYMHAITIKVWRNNILNMDQVISCDKVTQPISELSNNESCKYNCIFIGTVFSYNFHTLKDDFSPFA